MVQSRPLAPKSQLRNIGGGDYHWKIYLTKPKDPSLLTYVSHVYHNASFHKAERSQSSNYCERAHCIRL